MTISAHFTRHALARAQQRGIPFCVDELLDRYGAEYFDGCGCVRIVLTKKSIRRLEHYGDRSLIELCRRYRGAFKVEGNSGEVRTMGWQYKRLRRK